MRVKSLRKNLTEIHTDKYIILVSYETPVACYQKTSDITKTSFFKTEKKWSVTTSRHINEWLQDAKNNARVMPQEWFDNLL